MEPGSLHQYPFPSCVPRDAVGCRLYPTHMATHYLAILRRVSPALPTSASSLDLFCVLISQHCLYGLVRAPESVCRILTYPVFPLLTLPSDYLPAAQRQSTSKGQWFPQQQITQELLNNRPSILGEWSTDFFAITILATMSYMPLGLIPCHIFLHSVTTPQHTFYLPNIY